MSFETVNIEVTIQILFQATQQYSDMSLSIDSVIIGGSAAARKR